MAVTACTGFLLLLTLYKMLMIFLIRADNSRTVSSKYHVEPFSLTDKKRHIKVGVCNPSDAEELELTTIYDRYEPTVTSLAQGVFDIVAGERVKGIQTIEQMLFADTNLTGVGKLILSERGTLKLCPPSESGFKYILTTDLIDSVVQTRKRYARNWKIVAIIFFAVGGACASYWIYKNYILRYLENRRYEQLLRDLDENNEEDRDTICTVCLDNQRDVVLLPCGHVCSCRQCADLVNNCPICRTHIERSVPIFNS